MVQELWQYYTVLYRGLVLFVGGGGVEIKLVPFLIQTAILSKNAIPYSLFESKWETHLFEFMQNKS